MHCCQGGEWQRLLVLHSNIRWDPPLLSSLSSDCSQYFQHSSWTTLLRPGLKYQATGSGNRSGLSTVFIWSSEGWETTGGSCSPPAPSSCWPGCLTWSAASSQLKRDWRTCHWSPSAPACWPLLSYTRGRWVFLAPPNHLQITQCSEQRAPASLEEDHQEARAGELRAGHPSYGGPRV